MDIRQIEDIVTNVLRGYELPANRAELPLEVSARHVHLCQSALSRLFGPDATLGCVRPLSQPGEFLSDKRVKLVTSSGELKSVAVLGPLRDSVQVELSATDCRTLGISAPVNLSGNMEGAGDVYLLGDKAGLFANGSVIIARAHLHLTPTEAERLGLSNGQAVEVQLEGGRRLQLSDVAVRVSEKFATALHIDADEANACAIGQGGKAYLLGISTQAAPQLSPTTVATAAQKAAAFSGSLVTEAIAKQLVADRPEGEICLPQAVILTPAARDVFSQARVVVKRT